MVNPRLAASPFDPSRYVGAISYVSPDSVRINLPHVASTTSKQYAGYQVLGGQVGEFVFLETEEYAVLGRITEVRIPDNERLSAEPSLGAIPESHPIGVVQLLTTLDLATGAVVSGIPQHPRIGQHAFSAHPLLIKQVVEGNSVNNGAAIELATIPQESHTRINVSPAQLFGRHCAILGATGGGKSWTVARIIQEIARINGKTILIDPTGEFHTFTKSVKSVYLGGEKKDENDERAFVSFPYYKLTEADLFAIFQPSTGAQMPKLREALKSLKLSYVLHGGGEPRLYKKANTARSDFNKLWAQNMAAVEAEGAKYLIRDLPKQVFEECVHESSGGPSNPDYTKWGGYDEKTKGYCETLVSKIYSLIKSKSLRCLFSPDDHLELTSEIDTFLKSSDRVLRISMENLSFEHRARELLTNSIGRYLLNLARDGQFSNNPTVIVLDEAHQFLDKAVGDESNRVTLDAFALIAKEGRKYGLTVILATQRPRDIPEDVLSQMGMFVVHRLINERDRQIVEKACGSLDGSATAFLPTLGQGEAILVGVDFPMPAPVKIMSPVFPPKSEGPKYSDFWLPNLN